MYKYRDREEAGKVLAEHLLGYAKQKPVIVLALPRGGVPVAYEIASRLHVPLDVFIVRKLGVPGHDELAMGAIAEGGVEVFNEDIIRETGVSPRQIQTVSDAEKLELKRRQKAYRGERPFPDLKNHTVILVDDGIATGATMRAAIKALRQIGVRKIVAAVPVAEVDMCREMAQWVDELVCPMQVTNFYAVGAWYDHFDQTSDEEVHQLLEAAHKLLK